MQEDSTTEEQLTKKERKQLRRQEKLEVRLQQEKQSGLMKEWKLMAKILLSIVIVAGGAWWFLDGRNSFSSTPAKVEEPSDRLAIVEDDWMKGNKDARVTVIEYLDFECEACRANYPLVKRLSEEYGKEVSFVSRYFPLPGHKNSMTAALAVEAAGKQGKYWEMYDLLFEEQEKWGNRTSPDRTIFERYAEQLGLDMERFKRDVDSKEVKDRVTRDRDAGNRLKVNATPTFFLNGKKIENPRGYEDFKSLLEKELNQ